MQTARSIKHLLY